MPSQNASVAAMDERLDNRLLAHGLPALLIGGALLIAATWWLTLQLASTLAVTHVERKMADVAEKAQAVLAQPLDTSEQQKALAWLARFRDVQRLELQADDGTLLWRNYQSVSQVRHALPKAGQTMLQRRNIDGLPRTLARHHALVQAGGRRLHLLLEADVSNLLASYRQVAMVIAKAITTVLVAAIFIMGWLLMLRWREQRQLAAEVRQLLEEAARSTDWRETISNMSAQNAALLRRMLALGAETGETAVPQAAAAGDAEPAHPRRRA